MRICPNKRSKTWKDLVRRVGNESIAYNIFFLRDGDIEDITDEEIASYVTPQDVTPTISYKPIKPGVEDIFNENPEIASIGTPEQYSQYLDSIFPNSKVKDIVYHFGTVQNNTFDKNLAQVDSGINKKGFQFATSIKTLLQYGIKGITDYFENGNFNIKKMVEDKKLQSAILNTTNPFIDKNLGGNLENINDAYARLDYNNNGKYIVFEPEQIHILGSQKDVEGFKQFVSSPESLPKFKPKPANTLSDLEVEQFRAALETSLQMGGTVNFNYWSESTSEQISEKSIEVLSIDDNSFTGRYPTGEERVFRYKNMISKAVPGKYEMHEQAYFKSNLEVGKTVDFNSNGLMYSGTIVDIGNEDFSIIDAAGDRYTIRYEDLDKENYQRKIFQRASEMKKLLEEQIERFSKTAKSEFQIERIALLQQALHT